MTHPAPETVFIAGGGEGATLREALAHQTVKRAVMVEIDEEVTTLSRKYLPSLSRGAFEDKRTELYHVDARGYLEKTKDKYDAIIIDLPDPIEKGPAYLLFTQEFYRLALDRLTAKGIMSVQAGSTSLTELLNFTAVYNTLKSVFQVVAGCTINVPSLGVPWGFCFASLVLNVSTLTPAEVDNRIVSRSIKGLKFYDGISHLGMFSLPKYLRKEMSGQTRLITDDNPLYLYGK